MTGQLSHVPRLVGVGHRHVTASRDQLDQSPAAPAAAAAAAQGFARLSLNFKNTRQYFFLRLFPQQDYGVAVVVRDLETYERVDDESMTIIM